METSSSPTSLFKVDNSTLTTIKAEDAKHTCLLCRSPKVDELRLGPLYFVEDLTVHYFCLLFAAGLRQKGDDSEGILGFLPADIKKEVNRANRLKCVFCRSNGAPSGCCEKRCKASFHFRCGLENGISFQFLGNYECYCVNHVRFTSVRKVPPDQDCPLCLEKISKGEGSVSASCCKLAIFHRECIQRMAFSAGYFFKCPTCNDQLKFQEEMRKQGVFIPEQDASWELEPNAFQELLFKYSTCDAEACECPKGRNYGARKGDWLLARCRNCGSAGTHRLCGSLKTIDGWACTPCLEVEARAEQNKSAVETGPEPPRSEENQPSTSSSAAARFGGGLASAFQRGESSSPQENHDDTLDEVNLNLAGVHISPVCRDYFPLGRVAIRKFAQKGNILLDWKRRELTVDLVDVFNRKSPPPSRSEPSPPQANQSPITPETSCHNKITRVKKFRKRLSWKKRIGPRQKVRRQPGKPQKDGSTQESTSLSKKLAAENQQGCSSPSPPEPVQIVAQLWEPMVLRSGKNIN